jgi:hypothetical protein
MIYDMTLYSAVSSEENGLTMFCWFFALIARKRDAKKMLEAFSLFEEEHILPDRGVLSYVAKVLQSLGQPVPFEIPQVTSAFFLIFLLSLFLYIG